MRSRIIIAAALALAGCATKHDIVYRDRPVEVLVPVAQDCVVGSRPTAPLALNKQYTAAAWAALDTKQKAAVVSKHALDVKSYGENINGATVSCR